MSSPTRIQRRRTKGWRLPAEAVYVGRPTKWGNEFPVGQLCDLSIGDRASRSVTVVDAAHAVALFEMWQAPRLREAARRELAGRDLACWCPVGRPCHADVLLRLANPERAES